MREIPGYPGYYADEKGYVYSIRTGEVKLLTQRLHKGYYHVFVRTGLGCKTKKKEPVHKLVLLAFTGTRQEGMVCRHLNGVALDNRVSNLCWGTQKENAQDAIRHGTASCLRVGEMHNATKLKTNNIYEIRELYNNGLTQTEIAERYGITQRHVSDICRFQTWKHLRATPPRAVKISGL